MKASLLRALGHNMLPFADAVTADLPLSRLLRLSLFQVSVGIAVVLLIGTLNRVMIVELGVPAWLVAAMIALPLVVAPFRALLGHRSDTHRSVLGWRRVPFIWIGTLLQFGGLAIMPFALLVLSGRGEGPVWTGQLGAGLAFLLVGAGLHTVQTVGLALATDLAPRPKHPQVVAALCFTLLAGMAVAAVVFGLALHRFSEIRLIQVIQGAALCTLLLNGAALWKQEARDPARTAAAAPAAPRARFRDAWAALGRSGQSGRRMVAVALGTAAFSMQDVLLEPYGGRVLHLSVGSTTTLTATLAAGGLLAFLCAARWLGRGVDPYRVAAVGVVAGLAAFAAVVLAEPFSSAALFGLGTLLIGFGGGCFAAGTLTAFMRLAGQGADSGLALGAWGSVQATAAGVAIAAGGILCDAVSAAAERGDFGPVMQRPAAGYSFVYHLEIALLFATLIALGPLVRRNTSNDWRTRGFGIAAGLPH